MLSELQRTERQKERGEMEERERRRGTEEERKRERLFNNKEAILSTAVL